MYVLIQYKEKFVRMLVMVKLYHRFLKSLKNFGHDTNVLTVFRPSRAMRIA